MDFTLTEAYKGTIVVEDINVDDSDKWKVIKDEAYRPDRQGFIVKEWEAAFPNIKVTGFEQISSLASRSETVAEWLANKNAEYALQEGVPNFYRDKMKPKDYQTAYTGVLKFNKIMKDTSEAEAKAAEEYRKQLKLIQAKKKAEVDKIRKDKYTYILTISSTELPLSCQLAIETYSPADGSDSPSRATYAREILINFKLALLGLLDKEPTIDIAKVVEELRTK